MQDFLLPGRDFVGHLLGQRLGGGLGNVPQLHAVGILASGKRLLDDNGDTKCSFS